jgi:hypothetical protein
VYDDRRWVTLLVDSDPRHQHDVAWGWAEALMTIRSGTLRRSDRVSESDYTETEPIVTAERQLPARAELAIDSSRPSSPSKVSH